MANLGTNDKQVLEKLFQMGGGGVLNFTNRTFSEFFHDDLGIDIYTDGYAYASGSKANRVRGFWQVSNDKIVGKFILKLIEYIEGQILIGNLNEVDFSKDLINKAKEISQKLSGIVSEKMEVKESEFLKYDFKGVSVEKLDLDGSLIIVLSQRIEEIGKCLKSQAWLATIFLCGSVLEGILLGVASKKIKEFNLATASPKAKDGQVKRLQEWTLNDFINVAYELRLLGEDVKKFSHALRDFRNYIHPYQQMSSGFNPDEHTAKICWQVLQAAIAQLSK